MNISTSECSSGCESGWTMYLNQSSNSQDHNIFHNKSEEIISYNKNKPDGDYLDCCDEEYEDLSMVSDASSGPPHFGYDDGYCFDETKYFCYEENKRKKKTKSKEKKSSKKEQFVYLEDTASSPFKNHMVISPNEASVEHGTQYKGKSTFQKHIGFSQSSMSNRSSSGDAGVIFNRLFAWKKMGMMISVCSPVCKSANTQGNEDM